MQQVVLRLMLFVGMFLVGMFSMHLIYPKKIQKKPEDRLVSMIDGFLISRGLYVVAKLSIADELKKGGKTAQALAEKLTLNADAVYRLMRMLSGHGIFNHNKDNSFALNDISELMTTTHPQSLHGFLLHEDEARWESYGKMEYTLKTGKPTFNHVFGEGYFDYIARDKQKFEQFDRGMATFSEEENKRIATAFNFGPFNHIVDVGAGVGGLLAQIVHTYPTKQGTLYELPHVQEMAKNYIEKQGLTNRINVVTGSFLESVVQGGDLYILKRILHDWNDEVCTTILKNCRRAMSNNSRLVIFDCIVPDGPGYDISKDIDIIMMVIFGGKERTKKEFEILFEKTGFKLDKITTIQGTMLSAIEAVSV